MNSTTWRSGQNLLDRKTEIGLLLEDGGTVNLDVESNMSKAVSVVDDLIRGFYETNN